MAPPVPLLRLHAPPAPCPRSETFRGQISFPQKLAWPAKTKGRYRAAMLRREFQDSCLADAVEPYQKQEQIQPHQKAVSRLFGGDGLLLKQERIHTSFLQCRPLSARSRPAGEALPDARIRLVGYTLPSLKSPAARAFSMLEKLRQKPQQTCGWGIFSPLSMPQSAPFFPALAICFPACFSPFPPASGVSRLCSRLPGFSLCGTCAEDCFFLSLLARP